MVLKQQSKKLITLYMNQCVHADKKDPHVQQKRLIALLPMNIYNYTQ